MAIVANVEAQSAPPHLSLPSQFQETVAAPQSADFPPLATQWWVIFNNPTLNALVANAEQRSTRVQEAAARLAQAQAQSKGARANRNPQATIGGNISRQSGSLINAAGGSGDLISTGATLSYDVDILGRLSKTSRAARQNVIANENLLKAAQLTAQSETVQAYFEICAFNDEDDILSQALISEEILIKIVELREKNGLASPTDILQARNIIAQLETEKQIIAQKRTATLYDLAFFMGNSQTTTQIDCHLPQNLPVIPAGIPSTVLSRRPDVAAADARVSEAMLRIGIAKTSWLPQLSLTTSRGYASSSFANLLTSATQNIGLNFLLSLPFLDGGRRAATIKAANADLELAAAEYHTRILGALRDVETQLSAVRILEDQMSSLEISKDANSKIAAIFDASYANGRISNLKRIEAKRAQLANGRALIQTRLAQLKATISLVRALGGGWEPQN